jgi:hypothetical protein
VIAFNKWDRHARHFSRLAIVKEHHRSRTQEGGKTGGRSIASLIIMRPRGRPSGGLPGCAWTHAPLRFPGASQGVARQAFAPPARRPATAGRDHPGPGCGAHHQTALPQRGPTGTAALPDTRCAPGSRKGDGAIMREVAKGGWITFCYRCKTEQDQRLGGERPESAARSIHVLSANPGTPPFFQAPWPHFGPEALVLHRCTIVSLSSATR